MPRYKNSFKSPQFVEQSILDEDGAVLGTVRITPSSVLWKPKGKHKFLSVPLQKFSEWITHPETKAHETKT